MPPSQREDPSTPQHLAAWLEARMRARSVVFRYRNPSKGQHPSVAQRTAEDEQIMGQALDLAGRAGLRPPADARRTLDELLLWFRTTKSGDEVGIGPLKTPMLEHQQKAGQTPSDNSVAEPAGRDGRSEPANATAPAMKPAVARAGASLVWVRRERPDLEPDAGSNQRYCWEQYNYIREHGHSEYLAGR